MKRIILVLIIIFSILCQPCYAGINKADVSKIEKPDWELVSHDICIYTLAPGEFFLYKEYYPLLNGETRKVVADTNIQIHLSKENVIPKVKEVTIKIYNDQFEFCNYTKKSFDSELIISDFNSNMFFGNVTLSLNIVYNDDSVETHKFYFEKEDNYSDIIFEDEPQICNSDISDVVVFFTIENFSKFLYPEKVSVKSSSGKECTFLGDKKSDNTYNNIIIPFESDGLDRNYTVTIPKGTILLKSGLNNEAIFKVTNNKDFVTSNKFIKYTIPVQDTVKYIHGLKEQIPITIHINKDFKVDETKPLFLDNKEIPYKIERNNNESIIKCSAVVHSDKKYTVRFGKGMVVAKNGDVNSDKANFMFHVVDVTTINLPEKAVFIDVTPKFWAYDIITDYAIKDIVSGYEDKTFKPNKNVTRAEFAKILSLSIDNRKKFQYTDSKNHWANNYILSVGGFIPSEHSLFRPDDLLSREEATVSLVNVLEDNGYKFKKGGCLEFNDNPIFNQNYVTQIIKAVDNKIIFGYEDNTFRPKQPVTRAEILTLINRITKKIK